MWRQQVNTREFISIENLYGAFNYNPLNVVITKGEGVWVYDVEDKKYLDFLSAYSAVNQGHCHPRLLEALKKQAEKVTLTSRAFRNEQLPLLCRELCQLTGYARVLPMNSGAEAVETAIKAARKWGYTVKGVENGKAEIIVFDNNFHGRTTTIVGFSSEQKYREGFEPFTPGFRLVNYGDADAVKAAVNSNTVAVILEPVQGEGGIIIPPAGYLKQIEALCRDNNVLLLVDEIQTGLGRCGKMFAFEYENVRPDVLIIGKALSGGFYPVSAVLASDEVLGVFRPGDHGSTFGGNPLGCAVAREALRIIVDEKLPEKSAELGKYFIGLLKTLQNPKIKEIRGLGLFIGVELLPEAGGARKYCEALREEGLLCKETHTHIIRFAPPLVIKKEELDWAFERIRKVLE
ncbi:ornithine--oxo-acid transaminase [candidate division KSB1 bacterium]|nr:ornithine--oxo-acid transaminase [candidate division KSB1 bacterium]